MQGKITYHQQVSYCGKARCRKCRDGIGHGPYWYAYQTRDGHTVRTYIGKKLPPEVAAVHEELSYHSKKPQQHGRQTITAPALRNIDEYIARGEVANAIPLLDNILAADPVNEAAVQRLMLILASSKRRGEALRAYQRFLDVLQRTTGNMPNTELQTLYETIRQGQEVSLTQQPFSLPAQTQQHIQTSEEYALDTDDISPLPIGRVRQSPLVGREQEIQHIRAMLDWTSHYISDPETKSSTRTGKKQVVAQKISIPTILPLDTQRRPQCVVLMGEAGIGKTRLAEEMSREAQRTGWNVLWSRAYTQESTVSYRLWHDILRNALHLHGWEERAFAIQPLASLLPELYTLKTAFSPPETLVEQEKTRIWDAARELLIAVSKHTPIVIVLDDIQWADVSSIDLLGYLARQIYRYPILIIATCRENEISGRPLRPLVSHMQREHSITTIDIEPLSSEQIGQLVTRIPNMPDLTEPLVQYIQTQSAGNPFFAEELARMMPPSTLPILPKTVAATLEHRMGKLSKDCQHLLNTASVLGGSFELPLISAMEAESNQFDEDHILDLLDEAIQAGVLTEEGLGTRISYHFWHPLLTTHLYEHISSVRRTRLHRRAAMLLRSMYMTREEEVAATIVHHLQRANAPTIQIAHYAEMAGHKAYMLPAYEEAASHYRLALQSLGVLQDEHETKKQPSDEDDPSYIIFLLERLAECLKILGKFEEARKYYTQLLERRYHLTPHPEQAIYAQETQLRAIIWGEIARAWRYEGKITQAHECCERGLKILREAHIADGPTWARLFYQQSGIYEQEGRYTEAWEAAQKSLALFLAFAKQREQGIESDSRLAATQPHTLDSIDATPQRTRSMLTLQGDPVDMGHTYSHLGVLANNTGQFTRALEYFNTALTIFELHERKRDIAHVTCNIGYVYLKLDNREEAQSALRRALTLGEQIEDEPLISVVYSDMAQLALLNNRLKEAENLYKGALTLAERFNDRIYMSRWHVALGTVYLAQQRFDEAITHILRGLRIGRDMHNHPCICAALIALGNTRIEQFTTARTRGLPTQIRSIYQAKRFIERARVLSNIETEQRIASHYALARLTILLGPVTEARKELQRVIEAAQQLELAYIKTQASALLASITI